MRDIINEIQSNINAIARDIIDLDLLMANSIDDSFAIEQRFTELFTKYSVNPLLVNRFLTYLQLNNSSSIQFYDASDIKALYDQSCGLFVDNIDLQLERYYFYFNVLDEEKIAIENLQISVNNIRELNKSDLIEFVFNTPG